MRERRYLTFDMENPRHCEAFNLFSAQSGKLRSEYVIDCILKAQQENLIEIIIRQATGDLGSVEECFIIYSRHSKHSHRIAGDGGYI